MYGKMVSNLSGREVPSFKAMAITYLMRFWINGGNKSISWRVLILTTINNSQGLFMIKPLFTAAVRQKL